MRHLLDTGILLLLRLVNRQAVMHDQIREAVRRLKVMGTYLSLPRRIFASFGMSALDQPKLVAALVLHWMKRNAGCVQSNASSIFCPIQRKPMGDGSIISSSSGFEACKFTMPASQP